MDLKKIKLTRNECILGGIVIIGLTFLYFRHIYLPKQKEVAGIEQTVISMTTEIEQKKNEYAQLSSKRSVALESETSKQILNEVLESNSRLSQVLKNLTLGDPAQSEETLLITKIAHESRQEFTGYTQNLLNVEIEASFVGIGKFLEKLESTSYLTEVVSVDIYRIQDELKRCSAKIKLNSYVVAHSQAGTE